MAVNGHSSYALTLPTTLPSMPGFALSFIAKAAFICFQVSLHLPVQAVW